ncbi:hypothetical protein HXX76_015566 [Chlamydomonas incerta]|uniref:Uncharacterized protein n=1 Tax=Chlamydomonas incerta TaxID=51695 RepID=A0A835SMC6_CHLIN|nr:hypothetical protein HXX76_015566 [Chlamydomonas incerta]|eukprot:KAG2423050.1 hypothetical protein HXX76_015566 [Chlamydomonas incerta]
MRTATAGNSGCGCGTAGSSRHTAATSTAVASSCSFGPASPRSRTRRSPARRLSPLLLLLGAAAAGALLCCGGGLAPVAAAAVGANAALDSSGDGGGGAAAEASLLLEASQEDEEAAAAQELLAAHRHRQVLSSEDDSQQGDQDEGDQDEGNQDEGNQDEGEGGGGASTAAAAAAASLHDLHLDELPLEEQEELGSGLNGTSSSRKLMSSILAGPLPGLHFIPRGFPGPSLGAGGLGLMARLGAFGPGGAALAAAAAAPGGAVPAAAAAAGAGLAGGLASYVVLGQDPVAIALRQLSIVAIQAYGTAAQNSIKRGIKAIDVQLARYAAYLKRLAKQLDAADAAAQLDVAQREIRALVIARAALKDYGARQVSYVKFLTSAASAWTSWFYGIQYRFTTLTITLQWGNDPIQFELNRVLYSLADATKLSGLLLQPFIDAFKYEQRFSAALFNILFDAYNRERNRLTVTPVAVLNDPLGTGQNLPGVIARVRELAQQLGGGGAADALRTAALTARDQVAAALGTGGGGGGQAPAAGAAAAGQSADRDSGGDGGDRPGVAALERLTDMLKQRAAQQGAAPGQQQGQSAQRQAPQGQQQAQAAGDTAASGSG